MHLNIAIHMRYQRRRKCLQNIAIRYYRHIAHPYVEHPASPSESNRHIISYVRCIR